MNVGRGIEKPQMVSAGGGRERLENPRLERSEVSSESWLFEVPEENGLVKRFEIGLAVVLDDAPDGEGFRWEDWKSRKEE